MNVLIVDDQQAVIDSLKKEVRWDRIPVEKVYTALNAREARMALRNFDVDVLLTDIEMPEEDGLSLFRWMRENCPAVVGIFLTAHADFHYAQEAIHMGGFDYILQPFKGEEVEKALHKAAQSLRSRAIAERRASPESQRGRRSNMLDGMIQKLNLGNDEALDRVFGQIRESEELARGRAQFYPLLLEIVDWHGIGHERGRKMLPQLFTNVLEDIFEASGGSATLSSLTDSRYWLVLSLNQEGLEPETYSSGIGEFYRFLKGNMDFQVALYPAGAVGEESFAVLCRRLERRREANASRKPGVYWEAGAPAPGSGDVDIVGQAKAFIARNLNRNISRGDVAREVHLTEEYFSRLFSRQTGFTFKDYLLNEKMNAAKKLLESSALSVSIIASKVGYDNFSHFSQIFKKVVGETPQEYRKTHSGQ